MQMHIISSLACAAWAACVCSFPSRFPFAGRCENIFQLIFMLLYVPELIISPLPTDGSAEKEAQMFIKTGLLKEKDIRILSKGYAQLIRIEKYLF